jgi:hypothetical protein
MWWQTTTRMEGSGEFQNEIQRISRISKRNFTEKIRGPNPIEGKF